MKDSLEYVNTNIKSRLLEYVSYLDQLLFSNFSFNWAGMFSWPFYNFWLLDGLLIIKRPTVMNHEVDGP